MILKLWLAFEGTILRVQNPAIETSVTNNSPSQDTQMIFFNQGKILPFIWEEADLPFLLNPSS